MIAIVSDPLDIHARVAQRHLADEHGVEAIILNFRDFPCNDSIAWSPDGDPTYNVSALGRKVRRSQLSAVWWRRPQPLGVSGLEGRERRFAHREASILLANFFDTPALPVINDPQSQHRANRKPRQLEVATRIGLSVPATLVTNCPQAVMDFARHRESIYKPLSQPSWKALDTRLLSDDVLAGLDGVAQSPIIVQERLGEGLDVRVNVFGSRVFASSIPVTNLDGRFDPSLVWEPHDLDSEVASMLLRFVEALELRYGCIDLRWTAQRGYTFLEINPAGQFLFVEIDAKQDLTAAMCELLLNC